MVYVAGLFVILPLGSILYEIIKRGIGGLSLGIFTTDMAVTASDAPLNEGGLLHAVVGTLYIVLIASLISVPIGILTSLYLTEVKGKAAGTVRFFVQAMSGIPSIVAGLFIYAVWMIAFRQSILRLCWSYGTCAFDDSNRCTYFRRSSQVDSK
jgi:phosphate transport system permease protein